MTRGLNRLSSPRLKGFEYRGFYAYMITANTSDSRTYFVDPNLTSACVDDLLKSAEAESFEVLAYCFMPYHVHLLIQGERESSDLGRLMKRFKQSTGYRFKQATGNQLWHRSYHDRVLRREESILEIANYIWYNPVRAGLVADLTSYPYSGPSSRFADRPEGLSLRKGLSLRASELGGLSLRREVGPRGGPQEGASG